MYTRFMGLGSFSMHFTANATSFCERGELDLPHESLRYVPSFFLVGHLQINYVSVIQGISDCWKVHTSSMHVFRYARLEKKLLLHFYFFGWDGI